MAGASLNPDSASSKPTTRLGNGKKRSTENTAAASVEETMAPSSSASCQSNPSSRCAPAAVTNVLIATPTVANAPAGASCLRMSVNRVVNPPSTRMTASPTVPRFRASCASSNSSPSPSSPIATPTARNSNRLGNPMRDVTRVATMLAISTRPPTSSARYSCCKVMSSPFGPACLRRGVPALLRAASDRSCVCASKSVPAQMRATSSARTSPTSRLP